MTRGNTHDCTRRWDLHFEGVGPCVSRLSSPFAPRGTLAPKYLAQRTVCEADVTVLGIYFYLEKTSTAVTL